jgi:hypothetical protein
MSSQTDETAPVEPSAPTNRKSARKTRARKVAKRRRRSSAEVQGRAEQLFRQGKRVVNKAYDWAGDAGRAVPRLTKQLRLPQRSDLDDLTNPLVVGAIGLGIGVVLGTLMPQMITSSQMLPRGGKRSRRGRRG